MPGTACPKVFFDGQSVAMQTRAPQNDRFPTLCSAAMPLAAKSAFVAFGADTTDLHPLPSAAVRPVRIAVIGDSGCRIKGGIVQRCQDGAQWPFVQIAAAAAALQPDLVIHVGDYPSREEPCPQRHPECAGEPFGDDWAVWQADFFGPVRPLLERAPFVFVRGNHEECRRNGAGFFRLLAPTAYDAASACLEHLPPYKIAFEGFDLVVMDDAAASDTEIDSAEVSALQKDFSQLASAAAPTWLLMHRPAFGAIGGPLGLPIGGNVNLAAALPQGGLPASVRLMLSGHIHAFETLNYGPEDHLPPQLIAGIGGDVLAWAPHILKGAILQGGAGVRVADGVGENLFGFVLMTRLDAAGAAEAWRIDVYNPQGAIVRTCHLAGGRIDCPAE